MKNTVHNISRDNPFDIRCPACEGGAEETKGRVIDSRPHRIDIDADKGVTVGRKRLCTVCGYTWITYEVNDYGRRLLTKLMCDEVEP